MLWLLADCVNGEGSKVLMANFKILWIHILYLVYGFIFIWDVQSRGDEN